MKPPKTIAAALLSLGLSAGLQAAPATLNPFTAEALASGPTLQLVAPQSEAGLGSPPPLIAGQISPFRLDFACHGVHRTASCVGAITFLPARGDDVAFASIAGGPGLSCALLPASRNASCRVDLAVDSSSTVEIGVWVAPAARGMIPVSVPSSGNFRLDPHEFTLPIKAISQLFARQSPDPVAIFSGARFQPLVSRLTLVNQGPSDALAASVDESIPLGLSVELLEDAKALCQFSARTLHCGYAAIGAKQSATVSFKLTASGVLPSTAIPLPTDFGSDGGRGGTEFAALAIGSTYYTYQEFEPARVRPGQSLVDHVKIVDLHPSTTAATAAAATNWLRWSVQLAPELVIDAVHPGAPHTVCATTPSRNAVQCGGVIGSPLGAPSAEIVLHAARAGVYASRLDWNAEPYGSGSSTSWVEVADDTVPTRPAVAAAGKP